MTSYRVSTPEPEFTGEVGGLAFAKGIYEGDVPDGPLAYFRTAGYSVEELDDAPAKPAKAAPKTAAKAADDSDGGESK